MRTPIQRALGLALSAVLCLAGTVALASPAQAHQEFQVLVFSKTAGYRHASIEAGIAAIKQLGSENRFQVDTTEDASQFTEENLAQYEAVIWLSTTGNVLNEQQQKAFENYIKSGGGYAGVHAAADTEYQWPFYGNLVGAYFDSHPAQQDATVNVEDTDHPSTAHLPQSWNRFDEWYNYRTNPRGDVHVLATLDESSYDPGSGAMGDDHPIAWCQPYQGGRSWYTGMGHTADSYSDPKFLQHLLGGIKTAAGVVESDCGDSGTEPPGDEKPPASGFDQVTLAKGEDEVGEPMGIAVLPDGSVLHTTRGGTVFHTTADGATSVAAEIPVYSHDEEGLQALAIDPNFEQNRWVYLYYAPPLDTPTDDPSTPDVNEGDAPDTGTAEDFALYEGYTQLSRFKFTDGQIDMSSEQQIMRVNATRGQCCHVGGDIAFGPDGHLWLSTGDDTNPFQSNGYSPIDERENRNPAFDAQRTSANTNDLRGKVLRIHMADDGSYTTPDGNMFAGDSNDKTRPEIYAMGFRNPYRISVSDQGVLYVGNYGPDAGSADPQRGPAGIVEFDRITEPGFYGWPYCVGKNKAYHDYNFATGESGPEFDCAAGPVNDSPNNTGIEQLSPAKPAWLPYNGDSVPEFGSGSESPMGGPVYNYKESYPSTALPAYYDGKFFAYEWGRGWIKPIPITDDGQPGKIESFMPDMELVRPMDIEFGPDGSLYVLDYGSGYFGGAEDSALYRIDYVQGQRTPNAVMSATPQTGQAPLEVQFSSEGSADPDEGQTITYAWDFDGDGTTDSTEPNPTHTYTEEGGYTATLTVTTDQDGKTASASETIVVGNTRPEVTIEVPGNGQVFSFGDTVPYQVSVTDPDGTPVDCSAVEVEYLLGHSTGSGFHAHPISSTTGCEGTIETASSSGHQGADIYGVLHASYTDTPPSDGIPPTTGQDEIVLHPKTKQAEYFDDSQGVQVVENGDAQAGARVGYVEPGDWISFEPYNLAGVDSVSFRVSSDGPGGTIELHSGSPDGELVASADVGDTGGNSSYATVGPVPVTDPGGSGKLYLVFQGADGAGGLFDVDSMTFQGPGAGGGSPQPTCEPTQPGEGYTSLFDGTQASLEGWSQAGPGSFTLTGDCTLRSRGGMGLYWYSAKKFEAPYSLKLDWKKPGDDNSGVFVGFPDVGGDPWVAVEQGEEIQIDPTDDPANQTGAIYDEKAPNAQKRDEALKPDGQWNTYNLVVKDKSITIYLNGVQINHWVDDDPNVDLSEGFIGLQNHGDSDEVYFRNVRAKELPDACPESDIRQTVIVGGADTGVDNVDRGDGCTINDLIAAGADYADHGAFVHHVDQVTTELRGDDVISGREKGRIMRAASRSDIGK